MTKDLEYPFTLEKLRDLEVGDGVRLFGTVFTGRDRLHAHLYSGGRSPVDLADGAVYHCGPVVVREDRTWKIRAAGPTTSMRQDPFMPRIIEQHRVRVIVGKGGMGEATRRACAKFGCIYVQAVGGAAAVLAQRIRSVEAVYFLREFGTADALWELVVEGLDGVVAIDTRGRSLHSRVRNRSRRALKSLTEAA